MNQLGHSYPPEGKHTHAHHKTKALQLQEAQVSRTMPVVGKLDYHKKDRIQHFLSFLWMPKATKVSDPDRLDSAAL